MNQIWILKNTKDLVKYIQSSSASSCNGINIFDCSTLYTTITRSKLKDRLRELVQLCFIKKNSQRRYKYLVLGRGTSYFVKKPHSDSTKKFSETDIINMLKFMIDNIFLCLVDVFFNRQSAYQWVQTVPTLLADLFLYLYEADFIQGHLKKKEKKLARSFNFTFRYIDDDVLSLDNSRFGDFVVEVITSKV